MAKFWEQKWFKTGVALVGANVAGEYLFGETVPGMEGTTDAYFKGDTFAGKTLNYFGVTPFAGTAVGSAVKGFYDDYVPDWLQDNISSDNVKQASASFLNMFGDMGQMPSLPRNKTQSSFTRSDTNFQAGQAGQIPLGKNGRVGNALQSPKMQAYLAQHVRATKIPQRILAQTRSTGSTTLGRVSVKRTATRTPSYSKDARTG